MNKFRELCLMLAELYAELPPEGYLSFWTATLQIQGFNREELMEFVHSYNKLYPRTNMVEMDLNKQKVLNLIAMAKMDLEI